MRTARAHRGESMAKKPKIARAIHGFDKTRPPPMLETLKASIAATKSDTGRGCPYREAPLERKGMEMLKLMIMFVLILTATTLVVGCNSSRGALVSNAGPMADMPSRSRWVGTWSQENRGRMIRMSAELELSIGDGGEVTGVTRWSTEEGRRESGTQSIRGTIRGNELTYTSFDGAVPRATFVNTIDFSSGSMRVLGTPNKENKRLIQTPVEGVMELVR